MLLSNDLVFLTAENTALAGADGGFARKVAVLAATEPDLASANRDFLAKVLIAAGLNLSADTLFAEIAVGEARNIASDLRERQPRQVLVFGLSPAQLGLSFETTLYQPLTFAGCKWLFAERLSLLEPDKNRKTQLWAALKQMFL